MKNLRISIVALLVWLTLFFNIERLDISGSDTVNLATSMYLLAVLAMLLPLFTFFQRRPVVVVVTPVMVLLGLTLLIDPKPDIGGGATYITLAEVTLLVVLTLLSHRVGLGLDQFRQAVEDITLKDASVGLHKMGEVNALVQAEMSSSRRNHRPLSLLIFQADASSLNMMMHRFIQELQRSMMQHYVLAMTARVLSRHLRCTDLIIEDDTPGRLMVLAPETNQENARKLGERLTTLVQERLGITATYGVAAFPEQALTFDELLERAETQMRLEQSARPNHEAEQEMLGMPEARA